MNVTVVKKTNVLAKNIKRCVQCGEILCIDCVTNCESCDAFVSKEICCTKYFVDFQTMYDCCCHVCTFDSIIEHINYLPSINENKYTKRVPCAGCKKIYALVVHILSSQKLSMTKTIERKGAYTIIYHVSPNGDRITEYTYNVCEQCNMDKDFIKSSKNEV